MITLFGAEDTVPRRGCPRPDKKNQLLDEGLLAYAYKVYYFIKFFPAPSFLSIQATKLNIKDLLDDVHSPHVLVHDLVVINPNTGTKVGYCRKIC